jgi:hypothetical protein
MSCTMHVHRFASCKALGRRRLLLLRYLSLICCGAMGINSLVSARAVRCETMAYHVESSALRPLARGVFTSRVVWSKYEICFALSRLEFSGQNR